MYTFSLHMQPGSVSPSTVGAKMKFINPKNGGGSVVRVWNVDKTIGSVEILKSEMGLGFAEFVKCYDFDIGYITPGNGMRGKLMTLTSDDDVAVMYAEFKHKKCTLFLMKCQAKSKKRARSNTTDCPTAKRSGSMYDATLKKMHEVDVIGEELKKKHEGSYTEEYLRCWATMIQLKLHDSYDTPPSKPFLKREVRTVLVLLQMFLQAKKSVFDLSAFNS